MTNNLQSMVNIAVPNLRARRTEELYEAHTFHKNLYILQPDSPMHNSWPKEICVAGHRGIINTDIINLHHVWLQLLTSPCEHYPKQRRPKSCGGRHFVSCVKRSTHVHLPSCFHYSRFLCTIPIYIWCCLHMPLESRETNTTIISIKIGFVLCASNFSGEFASKLRVKRKREMPTQIGLGKVIIDDERPWGRRQELLEENAGVSVENECLFTGLHKKPG